MNTDEFKHSLAQPILDVIAERNAAQDELRAYRSIFDFLDGYSRSEPTKYIRLLDRAAKALGGRSAEIAAEHIARARRPPEDVRYDIGGWISGPCLSYKTEPAEPYVDDSGLTFRAHP